MIFRKECFWYYLLLCLAPILGGMAIIVSGGLQEGVYGSAPGGFALILLGFEGILLR